MTKFGKIARRMILVLGISMATLTNSGCTLVDGFARVVYSYMLFWETLPFIPVSPYFSQKIEDAYWEEERYGKVPILDPV